MSEHSDLLDEFEGRSGSGRSAVFYSISPALERAKAAREPAALRVVTTRSELVDVIRNRRDELGVTHETIDHITGWAGGYASKILSPEPIRGLGPKALALVLEALALGIVRVEFVEDSERAEKMRSRWVQRLRPQMKTRRTRSALLASKANSNVGE